MNNPDLSIVIPCLNEEENLYPLFKKIKDTLFQKCNFELILIDDDSSDKTFEVATKLSNKYNSFFSTHVIKRDPPKRGYGSVIRYGIANSNGKYCIPVSADIVDPIELIPKFIKILNEGKYSLVQCSRYSSKKDSLNLPFKNKFYHFFYRRFVKLFIDKNLEDPTYSFKMFNKVNVLSMGISSNKFNISPEIAFKNSLAGFKTYHYPSSQGTRVFGVSKFIFFGEGIGFFYVLIRSIVHKHLKIFWF